MRSRENPRGSAAADAGAGRPRLMRPLWSRVLRLQRTIGNRAVRQLIQRDIHPEDVASELVGRRFRVTQDVGTLRQGSIVEVRKWSNTDPLATVLRLPPGADNRNVTVPKKYLRPEEPAVAGLIHYDVGLEDVVRDYERGERKLGEERSRKGGPRGDEITRLEGLQRGRERRLNQRLIQQTMLNRFDPSIRKWVDRYNAKLGYTGDRALDPNLVKAMLFQESQMGTEARPLQVTTTYPDVTTQFNIGQIIQSSAAPLLLLIREEEPELIKAYHLENIDKDLSAAQNELAVLKRVKTPNPTQTARLKELEFLSDKGEGQGWEGFLWTYRAPGQTEGLAAAIQDFFDRPKSDRNYDYDFWIQAMVRWLFEKRKHVSNWTEAVRAFNGVGPAARKYRDEVTGRLAAAQAAHAKGKRFLADKIER